MSKEAPSAQGMLRLSNVLYRKGRTYYYLYGCECGKTKILACTSNTMSCGCQSSRSTIGARTTKHGRSQPRSRLYRVWMGMRERCNQPSHRAYRNYGGRGIRVCEEWGDYAVFEAWAIENGYEYLGHLPRRDRLSIDRIDNDGNYCPENCRWITLSENVSNKSTPQPA